MILTLIIATIREISSPEESLHGDRPVMTPIAFRHFPSIFETARRRLQSGKRNAMPVQSGEFPSLVELLLHHNRTTPYTAVPDLHSYKGLVRHQKRRGLEERFELTPLAHLSHVNPPFYLHYKNGEYDKIEKAANRHLRESRTATNGPRITYLTNATLIVVPANLLSQWDREIVKHCEYPLGVLVLRTGTPTPSARTLASDYDVRFKISTFHRQF